MSTYKGRVLGTLGHLGAYSYHETKNVISGEGGSLLINEPHFCERAEIIREKGTDRSRFYRGEIDKYTWQHVGSSYLPSELTAAFLLAQLESAEKITQQRLKIWQHYHILFENLEKNGFIQRPKKPANCQQNAHMYYILVADREIRSKIAKYLINQSILAVSHYVPLHLSPGGQKYARVHSTLPYTESLSERLIRLPLYFDMDESIVEEVIKKIETFFNTEMSH
jgi:dTDP-4-amino-4,6-dideoxygalactose transaminase